MGRTSLLPGFRFHPTDVELVLYFLKRKVMGKRLHVEAITEVNIYKFSPWDLPDKSCLKTKDLEWFFFCPREKKYSSGVRVKRATETGYWKTTGRDRPVHHDSRTVGMVKTLVFHRGHAPHGERTDWVIHEYRILNEQLAAAGVQDLYVLCKVFKKSGLGPKNGAQYGAPFDEDDWADDDLDYAQNHGITFPSVIALSTASVLPDVQSRSAITGLLDLGSTPGLPSTEAGPSFSSGPSNNDVPINDSMDEVVPLLAPFTDEHSLTFNEDGSHMDDLIGNASDIALPNSDGNAIYNSPGDLDCWPIINEGNFDSLVGMDSFPLNSMPPPDDLSYIELDDFMVPLNRVADPNVSELLICPDIFGSFNHENMPEGTFAVMAHYDSCASHLPVLPEGASVEYLSSDGHQMVHEQFYGGYTSIGFNSTNGQPEDVGDFT
ncbi:NAC domain-containing protein 82-like isoform X1 [Primulina huaijiensis]|uniref:NAC domain-containing protein 82-like isoform X1 n=1 Tax=Primulina huaijiensis TaxID=1492673 RepID=UPI003CC7075C